MRRAANLLITIAMKTTSATLRIAIALACLWLAFVAGVVVGLRNTTTVAIPSAGKTNVVPAAPKTTPPSTNQATRTSDVVASPSITPPRDTKPISRLARSIEAAAQLNVPQTIAALRKLDLRANDAESKLARHVLVARFAELDPQTALTYVDTLDGEEHVEQKLNAMSTWAARDPNAASEYFNTNALNGGLINEDDQRAAVAIAGEWSARDPNAAWQWATSLPLDARGAAIQRVAERLAASSPDSALQLVNTLPAGFERAEAMGPLAQRWAQTQPTRTADWVGSLRDEAERSNAASGLVAAWMQSDPLNTSRWVSGLAPGQTRDTAVAAMVHSQSLRNDPEAATRWASTVQDEALRNELVKQSFQQWQLHDADAANQWAASGGY